MKFPFQGDPAGQWELGFNLGGRTERLPRVPEKGSLGGVIGAAFLTALTGLCAATHGCLGLKSGLCSARRGCPDTHLERVPFPNQAKVLVAEQQEWL